MGAAPENESEATDNESWAELRLVNKRWWDERAKPHHESAFYDVDGLVAGRNPIDQFEWDELGDLTGKRVAHLQCHIGNDSVALARAGAQVVGLDFSEPAIEAARITAARMGVDARFEVGDVFDAVSILGDSQFDIVYTGKGAITWMNDIDRWAATVAALLRPGGRLYLVEYHPFHWMFSDHSYDIAFSYFSRGATYAIDFAEGGEVASGSYAVPDLPTEHNDTVEWNYPIGDVVSAVATHGMQIEFLHEFPFIHWPRWPFLEDRGGGQFHFPEGMPQVPLIYSLAATRLDP